MVDASKRRRKRVGKSSGFTIHFRGAGVDQEKMDQIALDYAKKKRDLLNRATSKTDFNARMGIDAIADGRYRPDRTASLDGTAANIREKLRYMKDLGLVRSDHYATQRMRVYARIVQSGDQKAKLGFLQDCVGRWKILSPQGSSAGWTPTQNGYQHYRIRPGVMALYAVDRAQAYGLDADTDDLALSALRFFTPRQKSLVDEAFLTSHIDTYFKEKAQNGIDYEGEFEMQMDRVEKDLGKALRKTDADAFARKCRNAGNSGYCFTIFLRNAGVVDTQNLNHNVPHWSATQQSYENTPRVPQFNLLQMTAEGAKVLADAASRVPVWYADIERMFYSQRSRMAFLVNELAQGAALSSTELSAAEISALARLGVSGVVQGGIFVPDKLPLFDLQSDMP